MSDPVDPLLADGREVLASQPFSVLVGAGLAARCAVAQGTVARLGEGS